jgi:hypothetical protein
LRQACRPTRDPHFPAGSSKFQRYCREPGWPEELIRVKARVRGGLRQSNHTRMGREKCEALMRAAYERGVRVFDLADLYGTHPFVISALKNMPRQDFSIITTSLPVSSPS